MKRNKKKIVDYLNSHIGENATTYRIAKECAILEDDEMDIKTDEYVRRIAYENGYRLNDDHCRDEFRGMPWVFDCYIEVEDVEMDLYRIMSKIQPKIERDLILDEYGIYDESKDRWIGFRLSIPSEIKELYDDVCRSIYEQENDVVIYD